MDDLHDITSPWFWTMDAPISPTTPNPAPNRKSNPVSKDMVSAGIIFPPSLSTINKHMKTVNPTMYYSCKLNQCTYPMDALQKLTVTPPEIKEVLMDTITHIQENPTLFRSEQLTGYVFKTFNPTESIILLNTAQLGNVTNGRVGYMDLFGTYRASQMQKRRDQILNKYK